MKLVARKSQDVPHFVERLISLLPAVPQGRKNLEAIYLDELDFPHYYINHSGLLGV